MTKLWDFPDCSYWVEFHDGPWDGQMAYFRFAHDATWHSYAIHQSGYLPVPDGGFYSVDSWKDEELGILLMVWFAGPIPEDLRRKRPAPPRQAT
jgi:hypothetical protein